MKSMLLQVYAIVMLLSGMAAQTSGPSTNTSPSAQDEKKDSEPALYRGFNEYESFQGIANSSGTLLKLDSTLGYDFNRYAGVFAGVPLYFAHDAQTNSSTGRFSNAGAGDAYFGFELFAPNRVVNYATSVTIGAPTGNVSKGFSTGHVTADWSNRFRHTFGRLTPFFIAGLSNTVPDSDLITRGFTSLGTVVHLEEGAEWKLARRVYAGASGYQIIPSGQQQIFNRLGAFTPRDGNGNGGNDDQPPGNGPPPGNNGQPSNTGNNLTRENGFDTWLGFEPTRVLRLELGYTRSATFALNSFSFNVGLNLGRMLRSSRTR